MSVGNALSKLKHDNDNIAGAKNVSVGYLRGEGAFCKQLFADSFTMIQCS